MKNDFRAKQFKSFDALKGFKEKLKKKELEVLKKVKKKAKKGIVDEEYVYVRKNSFYSHVKDSSESINFKSKVNSKVSLNKMKKV